jgi:transcriptional regulator with XRE-family HTH domain
MGKLKLARRSALARNIKALRTAKGWSQFELAEKVGTHENIIGKIERDQGEGEFATREAIADALGVTVSDLYLDETNPPRIGASFEAGARVLTALAGAKSVRKNVVLYLLLKDEHYLEELRKHPNSGPILLWLRKVP